MTTFLLRPILFRTMVNALFKMKMKPALFYSYFPSPLPSHALKYQFPFAVVINQIYGVSQFFFRYADITLTTYRARTFENLYGIYDVFCEYCVLVFFFLSSLPANYAFATHIFQCMNIQLSSLHAKRAANRNSMAL